MNGIGASLEVLQPFVDALDRARTVIRFDVPGVGGSPRPVVPAPYHVIARTAGRLGQPNCGYDGRSTCSGSRWGGGLAQHFAVQHRHRLPAAGAGRHRDRLADGAGPPAGAGT